MPVFSDGFGTYVAKRDGTIEPVPPKEVLIGSKRLYTYDADSGILEVSLDAKGIAALIAQSGPLPIKRLALPAPWGFVFFVDVTEIRPLPKEERFLLESRVGTDPPRPIPAVAAVPKKTFLQRLLRV